MHTSILKLVYIHNDLIPPCVHLQGGKIQRIATLGVKCKAIPVQARTGTEGSRRLTLPDIQIIGT
jgi:hypothetical protein